MPIGRPGHFNQQHLKKTKHMTHHIKAIPEGLHTVTPHLVIKGASEAIEFYKKAFGESRTDAHARAESELDHACATANRGFAALSGGRGSGDGFSRTGP